MSASHASVVIGNCYEIVDSWTVVCIDDVGRHVKTLGGEVDVRVELVAPVAVVAKPLQADDENGWQRPEVELL